MDQRPEHDVQVEKWADRCTPRERYPEACSSIEHSPTRMHVSRRDARWRLTVWISRWEYLYRRLPSFKYHPWSGSMRTQSKTAHKGCHLQEWCSGNCLGGEEADGGDITGRPSTVSGSNQDGEGKVTRSSGWRRKGSGTTMEGAGW